MEILKEIINKNAENNIKVSALFPEELIEDRTRLKKRYLAKDGLNPMLEFENIDGTRYQVYMETESESLYAMAIQIVDNYVTAICTIDKITKATYSRFLKSLRDFEPLMYRLILDNNTVHTSIYYPLFEMNSLIIKSVQFPKCNMAIKEIEDISSAIKNNNDDIIKRKYTPLISIPLYSEYYYTGFGRSLYDDSTSLFQYGTLYTVTITRIDNPKFRRYQVYVRGRGGRFQTHASLVNRKFGTYTDTILGAVELAVKIISNIRNVINDYFNVEKLSDTDTESTIGPERGYDFKIRKRLSEYEGYTEMFETAKRIQQEFNSDRDKIMDRNESNSTLDCDYTGIFYYLRRHMS